MALDEFLTWWYALDPRPPFSKAAVSGWRASLEARKLGSSSMIVRMSAIRKLAAEATDNGLLPPEMAAGVIRVKSAKTKGVRAGNWLSLPQAQILPSAPDGATNKGLRDRAILSTLLGCGLRRSEVAALMFTHLQQRDGRWCIVDLVGKHQRVRTVPMPTWVKVAIDAWTAAAGIINGSVFRRVDREPNSGRNAQRKDRLAVAEGVCECCRYCTPLLSSHMREVVSSRWWRAGADPNATWACVRVNN
jgi:integrase